MSKHQAVSSLLQGMFILLLTLYSHGRAAEIDLTSTTHVQERENTRKANFLTLRQYLDFNVIGFKDRLSLYSSGWFRGDLDHTDNGDRHSDELLYAYLSYSPLPSRHLIINLGRQFVYEGLASEQIDGASVKWDIWPMLGLSAFGGVPVKTDADNPSDSIFGGRLFFRLRQRAEVGVSYLKEEDQTSREELGVDVWLQPLPWLEVQGESRRNTKTDGWIEHSYTLNLSPLKPLILSPFVSYTDYDAAFSAATIRIFSPESVGVGEELTKVGGLAEYAATEWLSTVAEYSHYDYKVQGSADFFGLTLRGYFPNQDFASGASLHRMNGATKRLRYVKMRLYATKTFDHALEVSLDTVHLHYDESFNGTNHAYSFSGALAYPLTSSLLASVGVYYSKNPDFDQEIRTFLKIVYKFEKEI